MPADSRSITAPHEQPFVAPGTKPEPGYRRGEAQRVRAEKLARDRLIDALVTEIGVDRVLKRIALMHGDEAALEGARTRGYPIQRYLEGEPLVIQQRQASVQIGPPADDAGFIVRNPNQRPPLDYTREDSRCCELLARGVPWDHPAFVEARAAYDEAHPFVPEKPVIIQPQRSLVSSVVRYHEVDADDLTRALPDSPPARRVSGPPLQPRSQA